jgi:hypothetical protein
MQALQVALALCHLVVQMPVLLLLLLRWALLL